MNQKTNFGIAAAFLILGALIVALFFYGLLIREEIYLLLPVYLVIAPLAARFFWKRAKQRAPLPQTESE